MKKIWLYFFATLSVLQTIQVEAPSTPIVNARASSPTGKQDHSMPDLEKASSKRLHDYLVAIPGRITFFKLFAFYSPDQKKTSMAWITLLVQNAILINSELTCRQIARESAKRKAATALDPNERYDQPTQPMTRKQYLDQIQAQVDQRKKTQSDAALTRKRRQAPKEIVAAAQKSTQSDYRFKRS